MNPKLSLPHLSAILSFFYMISLLEYSGRSSWLKLNKSMLTMCEI